MFLHYTVLKGVPSLNKVVFAKNAKRNFFCATATLRSGNVSDFILQGICENAVLVANIVMPCGFCKVFCVNKAVQRAKGGCRVWCNFHRQVFPVISKKFICLVTIVLLQNKDPCLLPATHSLDSLQTNIALQCRSFRRWRCLLKYSAKQKKYPHGYFFCSIFCVFDSFKPLQTHLLALVKKRSRR